MVYGYAKSALVGVYLGDSTENSVAAATVVHDFIQSLTLPDSEFRGRQLVQVCGPGRNAGHVLGVVSDMDGDFAWVQQAIKSWTLAKCVDVAHADQASQLEDTVIAELPEVIEDVEMDQKSLIDRGPLVQRATCSVIQVEAGDSCATLATRCGVTGASFTTYNSYNSTLCSTLRVGQWVCCSSGSLPDKSRGMNPDGSCASYTVAVGEWCDKIAATVMRTVADLETYNKGTTWGWSGCALLLPNTRICISPGYAKVPNSVSNGVCGPQKPGTTQPSGTYNLSTLNPCPLNACCNIWAQCGTTAEFCTISKGPTGNPGTSANGTSGCISNCEMDLVNNAQHPEIGALRRVAYFEAWNFDRPCLNMDVRSIDPSKYNTIHFAFLVINANFEIVLPTGKFTKLTEFHRVISLGGWSFSTEPATYALFRTAVLPANMEKFATNCVAFMKSWGVDGIDFDWEYPSAPDMPEIPAGTVAEGKNYLAFTKLIRTKLSGTGKTLSFAAPAGYWYLRGFPIAEMAAEVDYIIYMTYDLHGQWDYGSKYSIQGCVAGNCVRSHVNLTETYNSLVMITKAGVPTYKIIIGISSYGRSFKLQTANQFCVFPLDCIFTGPASGALPGRCTKTAGYLANAEIDEIIATNKNAMRYSEESSVDPPPTLLHIGSEGVAYLNAEQKYNRELLNFGGTTDWAVDLQTFTPPDPEHYRLDYGSAAGCTKKFAKLEDIPVSTVAGDKMCGIIYALETYHTMLDASLATFTELVNGKDYAKKFGIYAENVVETASDNLQAWLVGNGTRHFDCQVVEKVYCCTTCIAGLGYSASQCKHCVERTVPPTGPCIFTSSQNGENNYEARKISEPCPPDFSQRGIGGSTGVESAYYTLKTGKEAQLYADLEAELAFSKAQTYRGDYWFSTLDLSKFPACSPAPKAGICGETEWRYNVPLLDTTKYTTADVFNPTAMIVDSQQDWAALSKRIPDIVTAIRSPDYRVTETTPDPQNYVMSILTAVSLLQTNVAKMQDIIKKADAITKAAKIKAILDWVEVLTFAMPFFAPVIRGTSAIKYSVEVAKLAKQGIRTGADIGGETGRIYAAITEEDHDKMDGINAINILVGRALGMQIGKLIKVSKAVAQKDLGKKEFGAVFETNLNTVSKVVPDLGKTTAGKTVYG
ncbi:killer toxin alpha/beta [Cercophora scortea]|uniref:chitinase n=1 Tax=Cercophora scortea TaxID=314031 RepID=A0AAE0MGJ4_9PEZI|nr:killer toxin alpha/beta [Cercophora scortea]